MDVRTFKKIDTPPSPIHLYRNQAMVTKLLISFSLCCLFAARATKALLSVGTWRRTQHGLAICNLSNKNSEIKDPYDPSFCGGRVSDLSRHLGYLDSSLKNASGTGLFDWISERSGDVKVTTVSLLDENTRFVVLSHGTQPDPIFNYGNKAGLELFNYEIEDFCKNPSRLSTIPELEEDREESYKTAIKNRGHGYIYDAIRVKSDGKLFIIDKILVWTVIDEAAKRIGLAAVFDRENVRDYVKQS